MAEGLLRHMAGDKFDVASAGTVTTFVRPQAIEAMRELDIDISGHHSKSLDEFVDQEFDFVITVCDNAAENCPIFPGRAERIHWSFDDPALAQGSDEEILDTFRRVRDEIKSKLSEFAAKHSN